MGGSVRVAAFAMDERMRQTLKAFFSGQCRGAFTLVEPAEADIALVDVDCSEGRKELERLTAQSGHGLPVVTVGEREPADTHDGFLRKPLRAAPALALLARIEERLRTREAPSREADSGSGAGRLVRYSPADHLQGAIEEAARACQADGRPLRLACDLFSPLFLPASRLVIQRCSDSQLQLHLRARTDGRAVEAVHVDDREEWLVCTEQGSPVPIEAFLWKVSLWTGRGRLPETADPDAPLVLTGWPNFTRLALPDQAMPIIAFWAQQTASVLETAELLGLPLPTVINVRNAAATLGLLREGKRRADRLVAPAAPRVDRARGGLLARMLNKLGGADSSAASREGGA